MNKVTITVLKTTFNEELVKEYGSIGLTACPKKDKFLKLILQNLMFFAMRLGKQSINTSLHLRMAQDMSFFIMAIGFESQVLPYAAAMMD